MSTDVTPLGRIANYLFLQMCIATCDHMCLYEWYSDGWEFIEQLADTEKLQCQQANS